MTFIPTVSYVNRTSPTDPLYAKIIENFGVNHGSWWILPLYHCPRRGGTPTEHIDVVPTPWATPPALGLGAVHCGGEHYAPLHTAFYRYR
jgi:hypothetical protein